MLDKSILHRNYPRLLPLPPFPGPKCRTKATRSSSPISATNMIMIYRKYAVTSPQSKLNCSTSSAQACPPWCASSAGSMVKLVAQFIYTHKIGRELTPIEAYWADDACLCRYLRARDWKIKNSQKLIKESIEWRTNYRPFAVTCDDVRIEMENTGKLYRNGFDKHGRPVIYMKVCTIC